MTQNITTIIPAELGSYWIELIPHDDDQYVVIKRPIVAFHIDTDDYCSIAMPVMIYYDGVTHKNIRVGAVLHPDGTLSDEYGNFYPNLDCYCRESVEAMEKRRLAESGMKFGGANGSIKH